MKCECWKLWDTWDVCVCGAYEMNKKEETRWVPVNHDTDVNKVLEKYEKEIRELKEENKELKRKLIKHQKTNDVWSNGVNYGDH